MVATNTRAVAAPGTLEAPADAPRGRPRLGYRLFDVDVHTSFRRASDLAPYLPERYRRRFLETLVGDSSATFHSTAGGNREDAAAPDGSPPGTNARFVAQQLLDPYEIEYAVCTGNGILGLGTIPDADYAAALARAHNDWTINDWLPQEPRFLGAIVVAQQDPLQAAAEIERVGTHPRMVEVVMSSGNVAPFGQRRYDPLYGAAEALGLPVAIHPGTEGRGITTPPTSAGYPARRVEWHTNLELNYMAHAVSVICEGVFVKFPRLRMILLEGGVSWVPPLLWRLDSDWHLLRQEVPHLAELPSTYFKRHIRLTSQPIEEPPHAEDLLAAWEIVDAAHLVLFSSDYPHWDADDPYAAFPRRFPEAWKRRIYRENARDLFATKLSVLEASASATE
ncbi:MAG: amidohydrolase [Chloroflexota bacterium]|nr:amidohydrolase [Chloroflexota bacterium]